MKYTKEEEIMHFVFLAFKDLKRQKEDIPLAFHSIMVGNMLKNINCDENTVYIGYLHDIIEDTPYDYQFLLNKYGKLIADSVLILSEDKNIIEYVPRKEKFIANISNANDNILIVELADKLQNLISDYDEYLKKGKESLYTEANNYEELKWFYKKMQSIFNNRLKNNQLLTRYNEIVTEYFD